MKSQHEPEIEAHGLTHKGQVRGDNQDAIRSCRPEDGPLDAYGRLYGIADGMGGFSHGGVASTLALDLLFTTFYGSSGRPLQRLKRGVEAANIGVVQAAHRMGVGRMGTTLTAVHLADHALHVAHVGDSRAYLVRNGAAVCLTQDHTRVAELVRMKLLPPEKVRTHDQRSVLDRCLGMELFVAVDLFVVDVRPGDLVVLCTDGVWAHVEDQDFARPAPSLEAYNQGLLADAMERGSDDNLSLLTLRLNRLSGSPGALPDATWAGALLRRILRR